MSDMKPRVPLKWHGGKTYLASRIIDLMPDHLHYVEPFFGGGAVLLAHSGDNRSELANDLNNDLTNFWQVLKHPMLFPEFLKACEATPLSRNEWNRAVEGLGIYTDTVGRAWAFFVACRQSLAGRMKSFTPPTRARLRRGMNGNVSEWLGAVEMLPEIHARLKRVMIENMDAMDLMRREDTPNTLFYCDPPYLHETRAATDDYQHEMTNEQHKKFLFVVKSCKGKVMISGYPSELYDGELSGWTRHTFDLPNNAAGGKEKARETEVVWCNW